MNRTLESLARFVLGLAGLLLLVDGLAGIAIPSVAGVPMLLSGVIYLVSAIRLNSNRKLISYAVPIVALGTTVWMVAIDFWLVMLLALLPIPLLAMSLANTPQRSGD